METLQAGICLADVCLPDYLQDHHNRDNEILLGVSVRRDTSKEQAKQALIDEFLDQDKTPEEITLDVFKGIVDEFFAGVSPESWSRTLQYIEFDESDEYEGEEVYAYFVCRWWVD